MGVFSMWNNHRARQAGKYAKASARQVQPVAPVAPVAAPAQVQPIQAMPPGQPVGGPPLTVQTKTAWSAGYEHGRQAGWQQGWRAGQNDLIEALRTGRVRWDDLVRSVGAAHPPAARPLPPQPPATA